MNRRWKIVLLLALSLLAFTLYLNGPDIVASHEARVALPARAMAESGWPWAAKPVPVPPVILKPGVVRLMPDWDAPPVMVNPWLVPVMSGQIRLQKPPLPYWCAAVCFRLFGGFSEINLRLVPALLGALAVLLVFDLGRMLYGRRVGWLAGLVWVSTYSLPEEYRKAMADPYLAFFTLCCVWSWVRGVRSSASGRWVVGFYIAFAIAFVAKGPPAFVDILVPIVVFHACTWKWGQAESRRNLPGSILAHSIGFLLALVIASPWYWYVWKHVPNAMELWRYESVGELTDNTENARPGWFYLPELLYLALPWTAVLGLGIARQIFRAREQFDEWMRRRLIAKDKTSRTAFPVIIAKTASDPLITPGNSPAPSPGTPGEGWGEGSSHSQTDMPLTPARSWSTGRGSQNGSDILGTGPIHRAVGVHFFPIIWYLATVVFFSFVHLKKNQYLLPMLPAQTLLIAQGFAVMYAGLHRRKFTGQAGSLAWLQTIIGIVFGGATVVLLFSSGFANGLSVCLAIAAFTIALVPVWFILRKRAAKWIVAQSIAFMALIVVFGKVYVTPSEDSRSAKQVAAELLALSTQPGHTLLSSQLPAEVAAYLPLNAQYDFRGTYVLMIIDDQHGVHLREQSKNPMIPEPNLRNVIPDGQVTEIQRVPLKSAPGDARWKVWELTVERKAVVGPSKTQAGWSVAGITER